MANGNGYSAGNLEFTVQQISDKTLSSLDALIAKLKTTMSLLGSTSSVSKKIGSATGRTSTGGGASFKNTNKQLKVSSISLTKIMNKVYFLRNYTKQMFATVGNMLQLAVDYTETLNLWQVAMRNNREEADEFVKTMNKAYGISTQTLMNYQAIFRNMLSSLGGISEQTTYALSEYLTQMALDYASLYNTSIERAMTTFQSVLSGQVRPIRSIAGYDITETTIYQLYQQLGGTKTMRQLTQTEKRLLRIYAVFQQMESSGAIGDLNKTLGNTANQMRILSESSKELQTWFGLVFEDMLKPLLPYLNAFVITLTNIVKAVAQMRGVELFEGGAVESVQEINEALDETQGKLLSFDRFEALNAGEEDSNLLGIDENLLAGLSQYSSILEGVTGKAQELADAWTAWWVDADTGELTKNAQELLDVLESIGITLGILIGFGIIKKIGLLIGSILGIKNATNLLNSSLVSGIIYSFIRAIQLFKDGDIAGGILATTIGITLVGALVAFELRKKSLARATMYEDMAQKSLNASLKDYNLQMSKANKGIASFRGNIGLLIGGIGALIAGIASYVTNFDKMTTGWKIAIPILSALAGGLAVLAVMKQASGGDPYSAIPRAIAMGALVAGSFLAIGSTVAGSIKQYKTGGEVEDGIFTMNRKEMAGSFDDGTSIVANNMQIQQGIADASYRGLAKAMKEYGYGGGVGDVFLNGRKVGQTTAKYSQRENVRTGLVKATRY